MARGLRIHVPDGWCHVASRANGGELLYRTDQCGVWGRDGTMAVEARHLGRRLVEVLGRLPGLSYAAAVQRIRRFRREAERRAELADFARRLRRKCQ